MTGHKGDYGRVLVVGGSPTYVGAPTFVAMAAYATGADVVKIAAPERVAWTINTYSPHLITIKLPGSYFGREHVETILSEAARSDVVVVGSGIGDRKETIEAVAVLLQKLDKAKARVLIDADAFKAKYVPKKCVLTPHEREFLTLFDKIPPVKEIDKRREAVRKAAEKTKSVILLKGGVDLITDGKRMEENTVHNPEMTVGGTGDTLAGILATFWAQSPEKPFEAAGAAAWVNGLAGDLCLKKRRRVLPHWLIEHIPEAMSHSL